MYPSCRWGGRILKIRWNHSTHLILLMLAPDGSNDNRSDPFNILANYWYVNLRSQSTFQGSCRELPITVLQQPTITFTCFEAEKTEEWIFLPPESNAECRPPTAGCRMTTAAFRMASIREKIHSFARCLPLGGRHLLSFVLALFVYCLISLPCCAKC